MTSSICRLISILFRPIPPNINVGVPMAVGPGNFCGSRLLGLTVLGLLFSQLPMPAATGNWADDGNYNTVAEGNLTISSAAQLAGLAVAVNGGASYSSYTVTLAADLDLSAHYWTPIGTSSNRFQGTFDGGGHVISNMTIGTPSAREGTLDRGGLFGEILGSTIKNVGMESVAVYLSSAARVGALVGQAYYVAVDALANSISNCYSTGEVSCNTAIAHAGGLVGYAYSTSLDKCYSTVAVTAGEGGTTYAGGLVGGLYYSVSKVKDCYATGTVRCSAALSSSSAGGLIGYVSGGAISNSYAASTSVTTATNIGGFVGREGSSGVSITNCYWDSTLIATGVGTGTFMPTGATTSTMTDSSIAATLGAAWKTDSAPLVNGGYPILDGVGVGESVLPELSLSEVTASEGDSGTQTFAFTVCLSGPAPTGGVTFDIATANNTATAGSDYVARSLTGQTIPAGSSTYTFNVTVNGDTAFEAAETFFVNVSNVTNATVTDGQGLGTITNDDPDAPAVTGVSPTGGTVLGGTSVTITGMKFTGATAVAFGATSASFTFNSDTQITATAPVHAAGTVHITVTSPAGTSATSANDQFTYTNDAPVVAYLGGDSVTFTEDGSAVLLDAGSDATVSDADSADFDTGNVTVSITANRVSTEDVLAVRNEGAGAGQIGLSGSNVTYGGTTIGSFAGGTGTNDLVVTLNSSATPTTVQALVRNLTYANTNTGAPSTAARTVRVTVADGDGGTSANADITVSVTATNDDPSATGLPSDVTVTEDTLSNFDLSAITLADVDSASGSLTVTLTASAGTFTASSGGSVTVGGSTTGTLTLAGTIANLNTYLDTAANIKYTGAANAAGNDAATVAVKINDGGNTGTGGGTDVALGTVNVDITGANDAPSLAGGPFSLTGTNEDTVSGSTLVSAILAGLTYSDVDASASSGIAITASVTNGTWQYSTDGATWNAVGSPSSETSLLLSSTTQLRYVPDGLAGETASLTFRAWDQTTDTPSTNTTRHTANTGTNGGATAFSTATAQASLAVSAVNDAPTLTTINTLPGGVEDTALTITYATLAAAANEADLDGDTLYFRTEAVSTGTLTKGGSAVTPGTTLLANGESLMWTPAADASGTLAAFTVRAWDGTAASATAIQVQVSVAPAAETPSATNASTTEDTQTTTGLEINKNVADGAEVTHFKITAITGGTLYQNDGTTAIASGDFITYAQGQAGLKFTPTANANNGAGGPFSFDIQAGTDASGTGLSAAAATATISVTAANDAPTVTASGTTTAYTEGNNTTATVAIDPSLTVADIDSATLASSTVSITGNFQTAEDVLGLVPNAGTMGNIAVGGYDSATGVLTLASAGATATLAQWEAALRAVTYANSSNTPNTATRTITFAVNDGSAPSTGSTQSVSVATTNDSPLATTSGGPTAFTEGNNTVSTPVAVDPGLTVTDSDTATLAGATVSITANFASGEDLLAFTNDGSTMGNVSASYAAGTGILTLTSAGATATLAQWQAALRAVTYTNSSNTPSVLARTVSFVVNDGATASSAGTKTVSVTATNDTPTDISLSAATILQSAGTNAAVGTLSATDSDDASFTFTLVAGAGDTANASFNLLGTSLRATDAGSLAGGTYSVRVQADDGHTAGTHAEAFTITVTDDLAPAAPSAPNLDSASDSGSLSTDDITSDTTPTFTGTAEAGSTVKLYDTDGTTLLGTTAATGGNWTITSSVLDAGAHSITAKATDAVPNTGPASAALSLTIDTAAPTLDIIARQVPLTVNTNAATATWQVTFAEGVSGVDFTDFALTTLSGTAAGTIASVTPVSALVYDVAVNALSGQGLLRLDLKASGTGIADLAGNALADGGFTTGDFYLVGATSVFDAQTLSTATDVAASLAFTNQPAQRFTTAATAPLRLTNVAALINTVTGTPIPQVTIRTDVAGAPGTVLATLTNPATLTAHALNVWTGSVSLAPASTYWVVFSETATSYAIDISVQTTGGSGSWLTNPDYFFRYGTNSGTTQTGALQIALGAVSALPITAVGTPAAGSYRAGTALDFTVNFGSAVTVTGTPRLALTVGAATCYATYASGSGTSALVFTYTVQAGNTDTDGIAITSSEIDFHGGTIEDEVHTAIYPTLNNVGATNAILVDTTAPTITSAASAEGTMVSPLPYSVTADETIALYGATGLPTGLALNTATGVITGTPTELGTYHATVSATDLAGNTGNLAVTFTVGKAMPILTWNQPAALVYGTSLSATQLNASANVAGAFVYDPPAGSVLGAGTAHTLRATFTPTDSASYESVTTSTTLTVERDAQAIDFAPLPDLSAPPASITLGASASSGLRVSYSVTGPAQISGAVLTFTGTGEIIVTASQPGDLNYTAAADVVRRFTVSKLFASVALGHLTASYDGAPHAATAMTTPADLTVALTYDGSPTPPTAAGSYAVVATITDPHYAGETTGTLVIAKAPTSLTWPAPASSVYGTALSAAQLDATANIPGAITYTPAAGTVLHVGSHPLAADFTPTDTVNYMPATAQATLTVTPAPLTVRADDITIALGSPIPAGTLRFSGWVNGDGPSALLNTVVVSTTASASSPAGSYALVPVGGASFDYAITRLNGTLTIIDPNAPAIITQPDSQSTTSGDTVTVSVAARGEGLTYQWYRQGMRVPDGTGPTLSLPSAGPTVAGIYDCVVSGTGSSLLSRPVVVGIEPAAELRTAGEVATRTEWQGIVHPKGKVYDQFLLAGSAGTFTASAGRVARMSFLDENESIVQVEMSGAGAVTIVLANASGPMAPALYNQPGILYMKGKATIVLSGADETTHFTIYSVGTATNPGVTRSDVEYAGWADVAVAGIVSTNGGLGGIHQGNAAYSATTGFTGLYAPTVTSLADQPVVIHNIAASASAVPYLYFGPTAQVQVKIAGGSLAQPNNDVLTVSGLSQVQMGAGQDSCGRPAPAQAIQTRLVEDNGTDVTPALVTGP